MPYNVLFFYFLTLLLVQNVNIRITIMCDKEKTLDSHF